jgi:CHAT domain-containing protein
VFAELAGRHSSLPDRGQPSIAIFAGPSVGVADDSREPALTADERPASASASAASVPLFPPLRMSRQEAAGIAASFPGRADVFFGSEATKVAARRCLTHGYRFVHFGTHGVLDLQNPEMSGVLLTPERGQEDTGILRLGELATWQVSARLITLSACETGLGKEKRGEGVMAFQRELLAAGAANVVASLWKVEDTSSAALMCRFYANLASGTGDVAEALRTAQTSLRDHMEERFDPVAAAAAVKRGETPVKLRVQPYEHPYYWAGFVVAGAGS